MYLFKKSVFTKSSNIIIFLVLMENMDCHENVSKITDAATRVKFFHEKFLRLDGETHHFSTWLFHQQQQQGGLLAQQQCHKNLENGQISAIVRRGKNLIIMKFLF